MRLSAGAQVLSAFSLISRRLLSYSERSALRRVEQLRRHLLSSTRVISTIDYGAGGY
jgi:hypothetical protein